MVTEIVRYMARCGSTTDALIVGIGYAEDSDPVEAFRDSMTRRDVDLTPVRDQAEEKSMEQRFKRPAPSGDAANFHKFIKDELIPLIEHEYRADPARRILAGHSYGGLFAAYVLFETPDLFDTLIVGSPTLSYGNRLTFQREEAFAKENKKLAAKVYLFVGEDEEFVAEPTVSDTLRFAAILESRNYEGFSLVKQIFPTLNHCDVVAPGYQAGLKFALKK
jgi:predicted alpha/beta superfamily hydrolase